MATCSSPSVHRWRMLFYLAGLCVFLTAVSVPLIANGGSSDVPDVAADHAELEKGDAVVGGIPDEDKTDGNDVSETLVVTGEEEAEFAGLSEADEATLSNSFEKLPYEAELTRLLDIFTNAIYPKREVFLRELISNAYDALERLRILSIADMSVMGAKPNLDIRIDFDKEAKTISVQDSGIGMSKQDLISNLGTVAKSGTSNFMEALASSTDANLIGQFGVGFYSAFLVADKVTVYTKSNDDVQYIWVSKADGLFSIAEDPRGSTLGRGTRVTLHLKEDATEFLNENKLKELVTRYSQFTSFPIYVMSERTEFKDVPVEEEPEEKDDVKDGEQGEDMVVKESDEKVRDKAKTKKVETKVKEWKHVNQQKAIWLRPKEDVREAEYNAFYRSISKDWKDPLAYTHIYGEGEIEFKAILFIPSTAPMDMFDHYFSKPNSVKLYARRVMVSEQVDDLLPKYLLFVKGVVDSDDLPLNVSREHLQQHKIVKVISKKLTRKVLELIKKMLKDSDKHRADLQEAIKATTDEAEIKTLETSLQEDTSFVKLWKQFSRNLKLGCYEDDSNRSKIGKLLQFYTTKSIKQPIGLSTYVANMKEGQSSIYYASGESPEVLLRMPQLQVFLKKEIEVVLLTEAMDEPCIQKLSDFEGKKFESIQKGDVSLDQSDEEKIRENKLRKMYEPLTQWWKKLAGPTVTKVEISRRLVDDPVAVVSSQWGYSPHMEKIMKSQTFADSSQVRMMSGQKVLEINPNHPLIYELLQRVKANTEDPKAKKTADMLYHVGMLSSGFDLEAPQTMARSLYGILATNVGVDPDSKVNEVDVTDIALDEPKNRVELDEDESTEDEEMFEDKDNQDEPTKEEREDKEVEKDEL